MNIVGKANVCWMRMKLWAFFLAFHIKVWPPVIAKKGKKVSKVQELNINNKKPMGLDVLLGHLLVKRIPVMYQLSSTKISEYLSEE